MKKSPKELVEAMAQNAIVLEEAVAKEIARLKETQDKLNAEWKQVEEVMITNDIKSIKGEWGSLTIAERLNWKVDFDQLPKKFIKKVADTKKISDSFRLEGKPPKGAEPSYTKYLTKRIKG